MVLGRKIWKLYARRTLLQRPGLPVLATLGVALLNLFCSYLGAQLFPGEGLLSLVLSEVFAFVVTLLICVLTAGMYLMFMKMARQQEYSMGDMLYFFKNQPDRVIIASFVMALIAWLTSLPGSIYSYTASMPDTVEGQIRYLEIYSFLFVAGLVLNVLLTVPFTLVYYIMADDETVGGLEALKRSTQMMKGHVIQYIMLQASFIPWILLSFVTLYLSMLWTMPYMEMTSVEFYRDLNGEFARQYGG